MRSLAAVLLALFAAGCIASTDVETMVRPDWEPKQFERIVVYYGSADLEHRKQVENGFAVKDSAFVPSYELFFAGETEWTMDEVREVMDENDADAALILNPKEAGTSRTTVPGQTTTTCTLRSGDECLQTRTTGGPVTFTKPNANFGAVLLEWETEQTVWAASAQSGGNAFADHGDIRNSFVDAVVESLREDGLIPNRPE